MTSFSDKLKQTLIAQGIQYAKNQGINFSTHKSAIIFDKVSDSFHPKSFHNISENQVWAERLTKRHTNVDKVYEMQSSNSSDALLMNIFCYPDIHKWRGVSQLLGVDEIKDIKFGYKPGVYLEVGSDSTEVDLVINDRIHCEAKLTEESFTRKSHEVVNTYVNLNTVFDIDKLEKTTSEYFHYQLIRNFIAAYERKRAFYLLCDLRRADLIKAYIRVLLCLKDPDFQLQCKLITWQELAASCGQDLRSFLENKYAL